MRGKSQRWIVLALSGREPAVSGVPIRSTHRRFSVARTMTFRSSRPTLLQDAQGRSLRMAGKQGTVVRAGKVRQQRERAAAPSAPPFELYRARLGRALVGRAEDVLTTLQP